MKEMRGLAEDKTIHWTKVQFEDDLPLEQRAELLKEYKETGSVQDYFFAPLPGQSTEPEDAWKAGYQVDEIDWSGFPG